MRYRLVFCLFVWSMIVACSENIPKDVLPTERIVPILVDIHLSEAINVQKFSLSLNRDSLPEDLYLSICKKHNIDRSDLEKSLLYYGKHTRAYIPIYEEVLNVLSEMEVKAKSDTLRPAHIGAFDLDTTKTKRESPPSVNKDDVK